MRNMVRTMSAVMILLLGIAAVAEAKVEPGQALDIEMFKRELERSHALAAKRDKNYKRNMKILEKMTAAAPAFPGPWMALARLEASGGNLRGAETDFLKALEVSDRWAGPAIEYAGFLKEQHRGAEAAALLRSSISTQPDNTALMDALAGVLQETGPGEAVLLWDAMWKKDARRTDAAYRSASLEFSRGRWEEAFVRLKRLRDQRPADPEIRTLYVEVLRAGGKTKEYASEVERLALDSGDGPHLVLWIDGAGERKVEACRKALERDPRCPDVWFRCAETREAGGDFNGAFDAYSEAYRLDPENKIVQGRLKMLAGRLLRAMPDPGPIMGPGKRRNLMAKAEAEMNVGNWRKCFSNMKAIPFRNDREFGRPFLLKMAEKSAGDLELLRWADLLARAIPREGSLVYAAALKGAGKTARADEILRKLAEDWPMDPVPCERLGSLREGLGLWGPAAKAYEEGDRRDWRGQWIADEARCQARKGDEGRAADLYLQELERRPLSEQAYRGLLEAYERNGRRDQAVRAARIWAQCDPLSREAWEAYRRLLGDGEAGVREAIERILRLL